MSVNKILIFGMPRTATTQLQIQLNKYYQLTNLVEPFTYNKYGIDSSTDPYIWTTQQSRYVMKLLGTNLFYIDIEKLILAGQFDTIVITKRKNVADLCLSLYVAQQRKQYHHTILPDIKSFTCDENFINDWIKTYNKFNECVDLLNKNNVKYDIVYYEDYVNNQPIVINHTTFKINESKETPYLNTAIPYKDLCTNYNEVENIIRMNTHG
jgi:hypothetical protein